MATLKKRLKVDNLHHTRHPWRMPCYSLVNPWVRGCSPHSVPLAHLQQLTFADVSYLWNPNSHTWIEESVLQKGPQASKESAVYPKPSSIPRVRYLKLRLLS